MNPTFRNYDLRRRLSFTLALALVLVFAAVFASRVDAQITRDWTNPNGSIYDFSGNWSPAGVPGPLDTARFDFSSPAEIPVTFFQDRIAKKIDVSDGNISFQGAGNTGAGPKRLDVVNIDVQRDAQLSLFHGTQDRSFHLSATGNFHVSGSLHVVDGTSISSSSTALSLVVDNAIGGLPALIHVIGDNPAGDTSMLSSPRLTLGVFGPALVVFENGGKADLDLVSLGSEFSSDGEMIIKGATSSGVQSMVSIQDLLTIGRGGNGRLEITDGGKLQVFGQSRLSFFANSSGEVLVSGSSPSGDPSYWESDVLNVYDGNLSIEAGALVTNRMTNLENGTAELTGADTRWETTELLEVGGSDGFDLSVDNDAELTSTETEIAAEPSETGTISVSGSSGSRIGRFINSGDVFVGGNDVQSGGTGILELQMFGHAEIGRTLKIWNDGAVILNPASKLSADVVQNTNGGEFSFVAGGVLQTTQFEGDLLQGGTLLPGGSEAGSTLIVGDLTQQAGAKLILDIGGRGVGFEHDFVNVSGQAIANGQLGIRLSNGFVPDYSDEFTIVVAGSLLGFFDNIANSQRLETVDGDGSFIVNYGIGSSFDEDRVVLSEFIGADGLTVTPDSMTVIRGNLVSGSALDLAASDNVDLAIRRANSDIQSRTQFEVVSTSPIAAPSNMIVTIEGSVFARSTVTQSIEMFDYNSGAFELVDSRDATQFTDSVANVTATGDVSRFVESGTGNMKARIRFQSSRARQRFSSNTDQFIWTIGG